MESFTAARAKARFTSQFIRSPTLREFQNEPMVKGHCTHSWIGSFAGRLIQVRPQTGTHTAVGCAVAAFHHAADIDPHRAVELFLLNYVITPRTGKAKRARASRPMSLAYAPMARLRQAVAALG